ncbi:MAG: phosphate acyltransferase PlsX [Candidatus Omnitrophica bacterium]|nr:phosphate acyltransferase PlsX [Candidatus Omnitrophota bacterium]
MRIALDGMGGDFAPQATVQGAVEAVREYGYHVTLVGQPKLLETQLADLRFRKSLIDIAPATETVGMGESALMIRHKKDSSICVGMELIKQGRVNAFVSCGNTGAVVAAATLNLKPLPGVKRPGIAILLPTLKGVTLVIDVGATIDAKPEHLLQYAVMGVVYSKHILKKPRPTVSLLNIGEEATKGTSLLREAYQVLKESSLDFTGNIEGRDIFSGRADVIVCDGFIGNVVLKVCESLAETTVEFCMRELKRSLLTRVGALLCRPALTSLAREVDYSECGGAPLLGIDGICIIGHGASKPKAIKNALGVAGHFVRYKVNDHIVHEIESIKADTHEV